MADQGERKFRTSASDRSEFAVIRRELDAHRLLNRLSRTHGIIAEKYEVARGADGSDRIRVGNRHLNVSDFLTQELHLPFREAGPILRQAYATQRNAVPELPGVRPDPGLWADYQRTWLPRLKEMQAAAWREQHRRERSRFDSGRNEYQARRRAVQHDRSRIAAQRRGELSIIRMEKVARDARLRKVIEVERAALRAKARVSPSDQYRVFLAEQAQRGNPVALAELRRQRGSDRAAVQSRGLAPANPQSVTESGAMLERRDAFLVSGNGDVTYFDAGGKAMIRDVGPEVRMLQFDNRAIETGIRLSIQKYGGVLQVNGDEAFRQRVVDVAAAAQIKVKFADRAMNESLALALRRQQAGRDFVSRQDMGAAAKSGRVDRYPEPGLDRQPIDTPAVPSRRRLDVDR